MEENVILSLFLMYIVENAVVSKIVGSRNRFTYICKIKYTHTLYTHNNLRTVKGKELLYMTDFSSFIALC